MFVKAGGQIEYRCHRCCRFKGAEHFTWGKEGAKRDSLCRPCRSEYGAEHYQANRDQYIARATAHSKRLARERTEYLIAYFGKHPCMDCGETDPVVLEFDHVGKKSFSIGQALKSYKWQRILDEIEQCEVVCANCHRKRTARRGGHLRLLLTSTNLPEAGDETRTRS